MMKKACVNCANSRGITRRKLGIPYAYCEIADDCGSHRADFVCEEWKPREPEIEPQQHEESGS